MDVLVVVRNVLFTTVVVVTGLLLLFAPENANAIDYLEYIEDLYNTQNLRSAHNFLYIKELDALTVDGVMCASGADRGRAGRMNESFIYVNGDGIPEDAVNIAGVFDFENDLEMAVFRGMHECDD